MERRGGIAYPLVICDVDLDITAPRIEAALRPHGEVIKIEKYYSICLKFIVRFD